MTLRVAKRVFRSRQSLRYRAPQLQACFRMVRHAYLRDRARWHRLPPSPRMESGIDLGQYVIDQGKVRLALGMWDWALFFEDPANRRLRFTRLPGVHVSTVFLGLDHAYHYGEGSSPRPVLWETMVFVDPSLGWNEIQYEQQRYRSRLEAVAGHEAMVSRVREWLATREVQA